MATEISLKEKIKKVMRRTGMTALEIAKATELPKENMYKWLKGTIPSDPNIYNKLVSFLDSILVKIPEEAVEEDPLEEYKRLFDKALAIRVPLKYNQKPIPQIHGKIAAGSITLMNNEPELIVDRIEAPFLGEVLGVIEVTGEGMEPTFKNGCRVVISRLKNPRILDWGRYYFIIDKNWQGTIKRIYPGNTEDSIQLVSDNIDQAKYPPITRFWNQIETIFKVEASILKY